MADQNAPAIPPFAAYMEGVRPPASEAPRKKPARGCEPRGPVAGPEPQPLAEAQSDRERALRSLADWALRGPLGGARSLLLAGEAGSGKSVALARVAAGLRAACEGRVAVAQVEARAGLAPACALAEAIHAAMTDPQAPRGFAALAEEAAQDAALAAGDAREEARAAGERLIDARRRLEGERRALNDLNGRLARVSETALYQSGGSRVDSWARARRAMIDRRLRAFGFESHEPVAVFKDLVRDVADRRGLFGRASVYLRALWGFRGQTRLLVFAALSWAAAWAFEQAQAREQVWLAWMREAGEATALVANALAPHVSWLGALAALAGWLALACLALNLWRAIRFVAPITRAVAMLEADVHAAQRELDSAIGQQTRLVDALAAECEAQARRAEAADRRAARQGERAAQARAPFEDAREAPARQASAFLASLGRAFAAAPAQGEEPQRAVVALDGLDALAPQEAAAFVQEAARLCAQGPFVLVAAADAQRLVAGFAAGLDAAEGRRRFAARFDAALRIGALEPEALGAVARAAGIAAPHENVVAPLDLAQPLHEAPLAESELALIARLAALAARTPAQARRLAFAYRLARPRNVAPAALAGALAIVFSCDAPERAAFAEALAGAPQAQAFMLQGASARVREVMEAADGSGALTAADWRAAFAVASDYAPEA